VVLSIVPGPQSLHRPTFLSRPERTVQAPGDLPSLCDCSRSRASRAEPIRNHREDSIAQSRSSRVEANRLSVRVELQADCFAGVWRTTRTKLARSSKRRFGRSPARRERYWRRPLATTDQRHCRPDSFTHAPRISGALVQARY